MSRMLKKAVTGEGSQLMKMSGTGEVFLADTAQDIHLIKLENDAITCNGANLLAFDAGIDWDIQKLQGGASSMMAGGLYNMALTGSGWVAIISDGPPVLLNTGDAPTFADPQAAITWSSGVVDQHQDRRQAEEPDGARLRRVDSDGLPGRGLGARAAERGPHRPDDGWRWRRRRPARQSRRLTADTVRRQSRRLTADTARGAWRPSPTLQFLKYCARLASQWPP